MSVLIFVPIDQQRIEARSQDQRAPHENDVGALEECKRDAARAVGDTKREYQDQIDSLKSLLASIQRRAGDKSVWDLSNIAVTPDQAKTLGPQHVYQDDIHGYLSVPASSACSFLATTEDGVCVIRHFTCHYKLTRAKRRRGQSITR
jgi:hypothetical protein